MSFEVAQTEGDPLKNSRHPTLYTHKSRTTHLASPCAYIERAGEASYNGGGEGGGEERLIVLFSYE